MAFTAHPGAHYNVRGSFNSYFQDRLTALGLPDWMPSAVIHFDYPRRPLTFPSFSVTHLDATPVEVAQGRHLDPGWRGAKRVGTIEINVWESEERASGAHDRNAQQMADMVARVFATGAVVPILDVYGSTASPTSNGTIARARPATLAPFAADPNPDVVRLRLLVNIDWLERVTAG